MTDTPTDALLEDLKLALRVLQANAKNAKKYQDYYAGNQRLEYASPNMTRAFANARDVMYCQNWCAAVVDATTDRLTFKGWDNPDANVDMILDANYAKLKIKTISRQIHKDAVMTGNGYLMYDEVDGETVLYRNNPRQVSVIYSEDNPNEKRLAIKVYVENDKTHLILYYPDRTDEYIGDKNATKAEHFKLADTGSSDGIPIVHFRCEPDLRNIVPIQDAINKLYSDMMVVSEYNAYPQRWAITNADVSDLKADPSMLWRIPKSESGEGEPTQLGQFGATDVTQYTDMINTLTNAIAVISRTPKYYFERTGANISGEALIVMESPLVKKVKQLQENFEQAWLELASAINLNTENTIVTWEKAESDQPLSEAKAIQIEVLTGVPLVTALRNRGWSRDQIIQLEKDREEELNYKRERAKVRLQEVMAEQSQYNNPLTDTRTQSQQGEIE